MSRRPDVTGLVAGVAIAALGGLLLADQSGAFDLEAGWLAVAFTGVAGLILLVSGLANDRTRR